MLKNYFKAAVRNLIRNKAFTLINISGLAIGLSCAMFIGLWVYDEYSFDRFHDKGDRIYQIVNEVEFKGQIDVSTKTPVPLAGVLKDEITGIEEVVKMSNPHQSLFLYGDKKVEERGIYADPNVLEVFDFKIVKGDRGSALSDKFSLLITRELANKLFPGEEAVGKTVVVDDWGHRNDYTVTGIVEVPGQSSLQFEYIAPYQTYLDHRSWYNTSWGLYNEPMFVLLEEEADREVVDKQIRNLLYDHYKELKTRSHLYPFNEIYLYSNFSKGLHAEGKIIYVRIFITIGVFIILIACINFMNLSTARAAQRAKEVGVRKTVGAFKHNLIAQFLGESIIFALLSGALAITFTHVLLPFFNQLTEKSIQLPLSDIRFLAIIATCCCLTGVLAGAYPALYLSSFQPNQVLKGVFKGGKAFGGFRRVLVVVQFSLSIIFIITTVFVYQQFAFVMTKDLGGNKENIMYHHLNSIMGKPTAYKNEISQLPGVLNISAATSSPYETSGSSTISVNWPGKESENITFDIVQGDENFVKTFGLKFKSRSDVPLKADTANIQFLVNEKAVEVMGLDNPLGTEIELYGRKGTIVGVLENFHNRSLFEAKSPVIMNIVDERIFFAYIAIESGKINETIDAIHSIYNKYESNYPFDYSFVDKDYARKYADVSKIGKLTGIFSAIAILVSCLGLFGLSTYVAEQRKKELGIRKAFGATLWQLIARFLKQFISLVVVAFVISAPFCWYIVNSWLNRFAYKIEIQVTPFVIGGLVVLIIALGTVSFNTIRAALVNPAKTLRQE